MILSLHAIEWFPLFVCNRLLINAINIKYLPIIITAISARTAYILQNLQYYDNKKCVHLLRPWREAKHFSTSKTVFINTSAGVDLSIPTL